MAKDGTNRGGRRVRAGDKPMSVAEKLQKGQAVRLMKNDIPVLTSAELEAVDLPEGAVVEGTDMPKPADYLSAKQKNGVPLGADEIYKETWLWLKERGCERLVNPRLIEAYAQAFARYIQCEEATSTYGLLGKHPTTGVLCLLRTIFLETTYASCSGSTPASISNFVFLRIFGAFKASPSLSPTLPMKR